MKTLRPSELAKFWVGSSSRGTIFRISIFFTASKSKKMKKRLSSSRISKVIHRRISVIM